MDEGTLELLSRALDGDLDHEERRRLDARLVAEPELGRAMSELQGMRASVGALAESMMAPEVLDALVAPLRRSAPPAPPPVRSPLRWLAVAASVALAVLVGYEIGSRRERGPSLASLAQAARTPGPEAFVPYQLKPLPTRGGPPSEEILGASERLLASTPSQPDVGEAPGLEVLGPVLGGADERGEAGARLVVRMVDSVYVVPTPALASCGGQGHWAVVVVIQGGRIVETMVDEDEGEVARRSCSRRLRGLGTPGLRDGTYSGEVVTASPE